ncbi:MAG: HDOD domain-containing protein [Thermodesulfobacteriota bacterium]
MRNKGEAFRSLVARMKDLPSIPSSVARITRILENPESSAKDVSEALGSDQSLASKVLKVVNSAYYGFPRRVDTLEHAVTVLGFRPIQELVLVTSIFAEVARKGEPLALDRKRFWRHAVGTALASKVVARLTGIMKGETVFLAGLLHDIGKVFLDAYLHDEYLRVIELCQREELLILEAENRLLGVDHTAFGYWLAEEWNLPRNLTAVVVHHHHPPRDTDHYILACLVHLGDILARALEFGYGGDELIPAINRQAWASLNLDARLLEQALVEILEESETDGLWYSVF